MMFAAAALIFIFNLSSPDEIFGAPYSRDSATGLVEVPKETLLNEFEVKTLDSKNDSFKNDTAIQYKKIIPERAE